MPRQHKSSTDVNITAKAEIKTTVPPESSGRTLDALTDLIRPISESLGWVGDKIRLEREKTLNEIAARVRSRLHVDEASPIPNKYLVPLLERASLEDINETKLIDMWANLIVTCATEKVELLGQYIKILSEITSPQTRILEKIMRLDIDELAKAGRFVDNYYYLGRTGLPGTLDRLAKIENCDEFADKLLDEINLNGVAIDTISVFSNDESFPDFSICCVEEIYSDDEFYDFENLCRMGLIEKTEIKQYNLGRFDIDMHYYVITPVGVDLYACCNPTKLQRERRELISNLSVPSKEGAKGDTSRRGEC